MLGCDLWLRAKVAWRFRIMRKRHPSLGSAGSSAVLASAGGAVHVA